MINAIRFTDDLEKAGFTPEQAKRSVDIWMSLMNENFATKSDFREFQLVNKSDLKDLRIEIDGQIKDLRQDLEGHVRDLQGQINELRQDMNGQFKEIRSDMDKMATNLLIKFSGVLIAVATVMLSVIALIVKS